jgi:uncharacterized damage-inducible protein DinB
VTNKPATAIDVLPFWARMNEQLIQLIDYIPDDKMNWSPKPELWNFRGILIHVSMARHNWLGNQIRDGEVSPDVLRESQTKDLLKRQLAVSWQRLERFLSDPEKMSASYDGMYYGKPTAFTADWLAYHLLEHDVHHRADLFTYMALLGIEHPNVETP